MGGVRRIKKRITLFFGNVINYCNQFKNCNGQIQGFYSLQKFFLNVLKPCIPRKHFQETIAED